MATSENACRISPSQMIGASEASKSLSRQIERVNKGEEIFILKNNAVKAVLLSLEEYEHLCYLAELAERLEIAEVIKERKTVDRSKDVDAEDFLAKYDL